MPKALEAALVKSGKKKGFKGKKLAQYEYGALYNKGFPVGKDKHTKPGVTPKSETTGKSKTKGKKKAINPSNKYNIK